MADKGSGDPTQGDKQISDSKVRPEGMIYAVTDAAASEPTPDVSGAAAVPRSTAQAAATVPSDQTKTARDNNSAQASGSDEGEGGCSAHDGEDFIAYCKTCGCLVCVDCLTGSDKLHGPHDTIKIKKLLQSPEVFTETVTNLSSLLQDKEQYVETLEQFTLEITAGHKVQVKKIKDAEKEAIQQLDKAFDREVAKLKSDRNRQEANIKQVVQQAQKEVEEHQKRQMARVQSEHDKVKASIPKLSAITAALNMAPVHDTLSSIVKADEEGKSVLSKEAQFQPLADVETMVKGADSIGVKQFTDLTVLVAPLSSKTAVAEAQTDDLGTLVYPHSDIAGLREKIGKLVPADTSNCNESKAGSDPVVMDRSYHVACHTFAAGKTNIFSGAFREPDVTRPFAVSSDITYIRASDAAALTSLVGVKRSLTQKKKSNNCFYLEDDQGAMVCCNAHLYDDTGKRHINTSGNPRPGGCFLPVDKKMGDALEEYLGWRPSGIKEKVTGKVVSEDITGKKWRDSFDHRELTVLK